MGACSGNGSSTATEPAAISVAAGQPARADLIAPAIAALEAKLGAPQHYFEVNATPRLVNLFVALNDGTLAQTWLFLDDQLSSIEPQPAEGHTFEAAALVEDPSVLLSGIRKELPGSTLDLVEIVGGQSGTVRYTVAVTSSEGGHLLVEVGPDGKVISVDPT